MRGSHVRYSNLTEKFGQLKIVYYKIWVSLLCFSLCNTLIQFVHLLVLEIVNRSDFRFDFCSIFCHLSRMQNMGMQ